MYNNAVNSVSKPIFSVVIPVYNVDKYLSRCLTSVLSQSFKNFEVICINDGSTDKSLAILNEYAEKDSRFKVISQANQGQGVARNNGIDLANGEYIVFVDPDDFIDSSSLEIIYDKFKQTNVDIVQFDYVSCKENGEFCRNEVFNNQLKKYFHCLVKDNEIYNWSKFPKNNLQDMWMSVWNKAYKTDFIKSNNIRMAPNKNGEDHIFSISANLLANKILYLNKPLYYYRTRVDSAVNTASDDNFCVFENIVLLGKFLVEQNLYEEYKTGYEDYVLTVLSWHYANIPTESIDTYLSMCKELLTTKEYESFLKKTKGKFSIWEKLFSLKNHKINGAKVKCVTILGVNFYLKRREIL